MAREMKDSGIEWIGKIPENWQISNLGTITESMRNGYVGPTKDIFVDEGIRYIQSLHIRDGIIDFSRQEYYVSEEWAGKHPKIKENDILIVQTGDIGNVGLVTEEYDECNCHALIIATPKTEIVYPKYLTYYLMSPVGRELLLYYKTGALLPHLNSGKIRFASICVPDLHEQKRIGDYLDIECAHINVVIEQTRASIEEYKKLKQAVITQAVTKGIRPERPMKDSGFDWMGKIPLDWSVQKTKAFSNRIVVGVVIKPADYFDENGTVPFLRGINVKEYIINPNPMVYISEETNKLLSKSVVHTDDLLIVRDGSIGTACVVPPKYNGANVVSMIIVSCDQTVMPKYLCYSFNSDVGRTQFDLTKIGTALTHTSVQSVSNIFHALPSYEEQLEIVEYIDGKVKEINVLIEKKTRLLSDLETYKKSLIYEYVTGKKEVPA